MHAELTARPQWVMWKRVNRDGKPTKQPSMIDRRPASHSQPRTWTDYETCRQTLDDDLWFTGIGFVFSKDDPFIGIDLDHVVVNGCYTDNRYADLVEDFHTFTQYSHSGDGLHLIGYGQMPNGKGRRHGSIELYDRNRFFAMTERTFSHEIRNVQPQVDRLLATFPSKTQAAPITAPVAEPIHYQDVLQRALQARNKDKVARLYAGDWTGYKSQSEADAALLASLAFWTQDRAQLAALWRDSDLWRTSKCTPYYVNHTLDLALSNLSNRYKG